MRYFKHILFSYKARQMDKKVLNYWWEAVDLSGFQYSKPYQNPQQYGQYRQYVSQTPHIEVTYTN